MKIERMSRGSSTEPPKGKKPVLETYEPVSSAGKPWEVYGEYLDEAPDTVSTHVTEEAEEVSHVTRRSGRMQSAIERPAPDVQDKEAAMERAPSVKIQAEFRVRGTAPVDSAVRTPRPDHIETSGTVPVSGDRTRAPFSPSVTDDDEQQGKRKAA